MDVLKEVLSPQKKPKQNNIERAHRHSTIYTIFKKRKKKFAKPSTIKKHVITNRIVDYMKTDFPIANILRMEEKLILPSLTPIKPKQVSIGAQ